MAKYYQMTTPDFIVLTDDNPVSFPLLLHDKWEDFNEERLQEYFQKSYEIFLNRLKEFQNLKRPLSTREEKELTFMLEALMNAKNSLCRK